MSKRKSSDYGVDDPDGLDRLTGEPQDADASTPTSSSAEVPGGASDGTSSTSPAADDGTTPAADAPSDKAPAKPAPLAASGVVGGASQSDIEVAKERYGGEIPRSAPKGGEGSNATVREVRHPELEPPPPPAELRVAPSAPTESDRPSFGSEKPSLEELRNAVTLELQTVDELSAGEFVAGVMVQRTPTEVPVASILARGDTYLRALLTDPRIEVRVKQ